MYCNEIFLLVIYPVHSTEMKFNLFVICSYFNECRQCSDVTLGNASSVSVVDRTNCNETRLYNMAVTNSFEELYRESKNCCLGRLTIKYRTGEVDKVIYYISKNETLFTVLDESNSVVTIFGTK